MNTSRRKRYAPKHSIEERVEEVEIIENVKNFHKNPNPAPAEKGAEEFGEYCGSSQFYTLLMVSCLLQFQLYL